MATAKDLFDKALLIDMGSTFVIPCYNKQHMESVRVMLSRQRTIFQNSASVDFDILVSRMTENNKFFVTLKKVPRLSTGMIIGRDGSITEVDLDAKDPVEDVVTETIELERVKAKMREDGYSEDEINKQLGIVEGDSCEEGNNS